MTPAQNATQAQRQRAQTVSADPGSVVDHTVDHVIQPGPVFTSESQKLTVTGNGGALSTDVVDDAALADLGGAGNENVKREDMATPFLLLLQALSPEVDPASPKHLSGAAAGMFCNTLTHQLYDGKAGLEVIDCYFEPLLTRWVPRDKGGGFKGTLEPSDPLLKRGRPSEKNELTTVLPDGTEVVNINQHYLLARPYLPSTSVANTPVINELIWSPCVLGLTSTQIKKSRALNAELNLMRVTVAGVQKAIPRFATVFRLTAQPEKNAKGSYWGVRFDNLRRVNTLELGMGRLLYEALAKGVGRAAPSEETHGAPAEPAATDDGRGRVEEEIPY